jgi:glycosyltransferase involved in cell wall biosynthesis
MTEALFWGSVLLIVHAYFGYPLTLLLLYRFRNRPFRREAIIPPATLIIAACNEEKRIREKLENTVALEYPRERLQIIVTSDGSTDGTHSIVEEYADRGVELLALPERRGKENAQKEAVGLATGEVIIFSDVATRIEPDGLKKIVSSFADPSVGCVSSVDRVIGRDGKPCGEGLYVRYEMWLRDLESRVHSLVGLSGSFFAARRDVCRDFSADMQSDFRTVLNSMRLGLRGISDPESVGYYMDISDSRREFDRKVRTVLRGQTVFFRHLEFLNAFRYGLFSYQYLCHKLLRWLVPVFLFLALAANAILSLGSPWFLAIFIGHLSFYGIALWGGSRKVQPDHPVMKIPLYFLTVNAAILVAWWRYLKGNRMVMWAPSER